MKRNEFKYQILILSLICTIGLYACKSTDGELENIKNDQFWSTVNGQPLYSQGGGIFKFIDPIDGIEKYYWYGAEYKEAAEFHNDPSITPKKDNFLAVNLYTSPDLVNWRFVDKVLNRKEVDQHAENTRWMGRLGVAFIKDLEVYAMFIQHDAGVLIAISQSPNGPFKWHQRLDMTNTIGTPNTGDQTVFTDEDTGISYLVYSYGRGRSKIYISEIGTKDGKVDLLDCTEVYRGDGREGNCMFKYNGKYYLFASNLYGWDSSYAYHLVSDDIRGPYLPTNHMKITKGVIDDFAHITQTGFFVNVKGTKKETVIYCGDRWANFAGNGLGYNQWCPLSFDGDEPYFNSLNSWDINVTTGDWNVSEDNNYVKNGSFEADRRHIPSPIKPIQTELTGWDTQILKGNDIKNEDSSPVLNHFNTREDRQFVVGEKSLNISDIVDFKRKVSQTITSTPYIKLKSGKYILSLKIKNTNGFNNLEVYATSSNKRVTKKIIKPNNTWTDISINNLTVKNGIVEIGILAEGEPYANCQVDDVTLIKE